MAKEKSNAAAEREAAAKIKDSLPDRDTYTAKQVATRCGTDAKTLRKFLRSSHSTAEPVGQGGRYEFDADDLPLIREEFTAWRKKAEARKTGSTKKELDDLADPIEDAQQEDDPLEVFKRKPIQEEIDELHSWAKEKYDDKEPTPEELAELEDMGLEDLELEDDD